MYCRKCGKEVGENSKFCPFCGYRLEGGQDREPDTVKQNVQPQKTDKNVSSKKWILSVGIIAGIAVIGTAVFLGINAVRKPEDLLQPEAAEEREEPAQEEQKVAYPQEITMSENEKKGITDLLDLVSHIEGAGDYKEIENGFADLFLRTSIQRGIPFVNGQTADDYVIPKDALDQYLKNSIGYQNYDVGYGGEVNHDVIQLYGACGEIIPSNHAPQISRMTQISEEEIEITGTVAYTESDDIGFLPYTAEFTVVMAKNPESMWGGYTLKEIRNWEQQENENDTSRAWKQSFIDYINPQGLYAKTSGSPDQTEDGDSKVYKLWDMDQDGVPEVLCTYFQDSASSTIVLAYNPWNSSIMENSLGRFLTCNGNELCGSNAHGGAGYSTVYTKNADGSLEEKFTFGFSQDVSSDSYQVTYYLGEQEISEEEYQQLTDQYSQPLEMDMTYAELIQAIKEY